MRDETSQATKKQSEVTYSPAVNQLGFGSTIARNDPGGVSCDGAAKTELIDSCTVFVLC